MQNFSAKVLRIFAWIAGLDALMVTHQTERTTLRALFGLVPLWLKIATVAAVLYGLAVDELGGANAELAMAGMMLAFAIVEFTVLFGLARFARTQITLPLREGR